MPSSQIQSNITTNIIGNSNSTNQSNVANKMLPTKLPPPPPPPPKNVRPAPPPPPLPPPPPRISSQLSSQSNLASNQLCTSNGPSAGLTLNNGSSVNSLNSTGRCSHFQSTVGGSSNHSQRGFARHGECGSRSSVSSHGSQHHYHIGLHNMIPTGNSTVTGFNNGSTSGTGSISSCAHPPTCTWSLTNQQHNHPISSAASDNEISCNLVNHNTETRSICQVPRSTCCSSHHVHGPSHKCQNQIPPSIATNARINCNDAGTNGQITTANRNHNNSFLNPETSSMISSGGYCNNDFNRAHLNNTFQHHHHHHHNLHTTQLSSSSSISSVPPGDANNNPAVHRCNNLPVQTGAAPALMNANIESDTISRPDAGVHQPMCNHVHRSNGCNHHHPPTCFNHHQSIDISQQATHVCGNNGGSRTGCSHAHGPVDGVRHECFSNVQLNKCCKTNPTHHHCPTEIVMNRCSDVINTNGSIQSTAHTHNLSNSSTTTHTSNVAVKHQPQFHHPVISRGGRSNSSQHYEQYGLSSAASTSSATASLSSYQNPVAYDDTTPLYPSKFHQPLPPLPPPLPPTKSQPASPAHQMFNNVPQMVHQQQQFIGLNYQSHQTSQTNHHHPHHHQQLPPPPPPQPISSGNHHQHSQAFETSLPPLPPRPISPNASSCSTQITTVRTSPSLHNQPVTRVTSQAGVQNPLPNSDIPPPLPPLNPGSRTQPLINSTMTKIHQNLTCDNSMLLNSPNHNLINLNYDRGEVERKTGAFTKQVESEFEQQQMRLAETIHGICRKCHTKVSSSQEACKAMNQIYHANCFVCCECGRTLWDKEFYPVDDKIYCEDDYKGRILSPEKCAECSQPIYDMIITAIGKSFHPECFKCCICGKCLENIQFTFDKENKIYCVDDYHSVYSPKCARCGKSISPLDGTDETVRVVSMGKDYHIDCYCCEDCGLQLTDDEPSRSYPLDNHLLCQNCHINRLSKMQASLSIR